MQKNRLIEEAKTFFQNTEKAKSEAKRHDGLLTQEKNALAGLLDSFQKIAPENFVPNRQDLLEKLAREIDHLGAQHQNFTKLNGLNIDYRSALSQLASLETRLAELRQQELWLDKSLLTAYEAADDWERQLEYRREVYNQQLQLANYEKDRASLKEGDPCPLCLSTHHPFRLHDVKPFVDEARNDLQAAEKVQRERQQERSILLKKHIEINTQIQQIEGLDGGEMGKQEARIGELERRLASFLPGLDGEDFSRSHGDWLANKLDNFEAELAEKKSVREQLAAMNGQISSKEEQVRALENQLKDARFAEQQNEQSRLDRETSLLGLEATFQDVTAALDKLLGKYGHRFSLETAKQMFSELKAKEAEFSTKKASREGHERQLELTRQSLRQLAVTQVDLERKCQQFNEEAAQLQTEIDTLNAKRLAAFGEKNPVAEREKLLAAIELAEKELATSRSQHEQAKERLARTRQQLESSETQLAVSQKAVEELEKNLKTGLAKSGFDSVEALRSAILPVVEAERIEALAEKMKLREVAFRQESKSAQAALEAALAKPLTTENAPELAAKVEGFDVELQQLQQAHS